jgi:chromosome segregation ATPase
MNQKKDGTFTLGENESAAIESAESLPDPGIRSVRRSVRTLALLLTLLMTALLAAGYLDLRKRVGTIHRTGTTEVKSLSNDLENRFASLSESSTTMQKELLQRIEGLEKQVIGLEGQLKTANRTLASLGKASVSHQALKEELKKAMSTPDASISSLKKEIQRLDAALTELQKARQQQASGLAAELAASEERMTAKLEDFSRETDAALSEHVRQKTFKLELFKEQKKNQVRLDAMEKRWGEKFLFLEQKVDDLGRSGSTAPPPAPDDIVEKQID